MARDEGEALNPLPIGWMEIALGEVGAWTGGGTPAKSEPAFWNEGVVPWVSPKDMKSNRIREAEDKITHAAISGSAAKLIPPGAVLMVTRSGILAHTFPVAVTDVEVTINQDLKAVSAYSFCIPEFLFWFLRSRNFEILRDCAKDGTTVASIETDRLKNFRLPLAPLAEQRRIVSRIDELFSRIDAGERAIVEARAGLKRYRKAVLKAAVTGALTEDWRVANPSKETGADLLVSILDARRTAWLKTETEKLKAKSKSPPKSAADEEKLLAKYAPAKTIEEQELPEVPTGWVWATLAQLTLIKGGVTVDNKRQPASPVTVPYLRVANVQAGRTDLAEVKQITVEEARAKDCLLKSGDILLNEGGDLDKLGRGWVWYGQIDPCIHQNHVFRARPVSDLVTPEYVSHYTNAMGQTFFMEKGKQSVNLASISLTAISKLPVPLPPPAEQSEIVSRVEEALSRADAAEATLNAQARAARALKQSILKAAFAGHLVRQDLTDEPASELLTRIRETAA